VNHVQSTPASSPTVEYEIVNQRAAPVTGQAVPSYGPQFAGEYFKKLGMLLLHAADVAPGETRRMPVTFVVDRSCPGASVRSRFPTTSSSPRGAGASRDGGGQAVRSGFNRHRRRADAEKNAAQSGARDHPRRGFVVLFILTLATIVHFVTS